MEEGEKMIIKMTDDKDLIITIKTTLYRGEKNADIIRFLIPAEYEGRNMADCAFLMRYIDANGSGRSEALGYLPEMYKDYLQLSTVVNTRLTVADGEVTIWLTAIDSNDSVVLKTGEVIVDINPSKNITDYFSDEDLDELDALAAKVDMIDKTKADDITCDLVTGEIQLSSHGEKIGSSVDLGDVDDVTNDAIHFESSEGSTNPPTDSGDDVIHF